MLNGKQISEVTPKGIKYVDENNVEQFIDFAQCYQNYVNERLSVETWEKLKKVNHQTDENRDKYVQTVKTFKQVGVRQVLTPPWADGPYIEFFTDPKLRFKFETQEEWENIVDTVYDAGYRLFDQS